MQAGAEAAHGGRPARPVPPGRLCADEGYGYAHLRRRLCAGGVGYRFAGKYVAF